MGCYPLRWTFTTKEMTLRKDNIADVSRMDRAQRLSLELAARALAHRHVEDDSSIELSRQLLREMASAGE